MSENIDNSSNSDQDNSGNSINEQEKTGESQDPSLNEEMSSEDTFKKDTDTKDSGEDELELPEPDISDEEIKKKKEMPEWMKKKLEREKRKEQEILAEAERLKQENERLKLGHSSADIPATLDPFLPKREQYKSDEEYFFALADYRDTVRHQTSEFTRRQQAIKEAETNFKNKLQETLEDGNSKYKDFAERTDYILYGEKFPNNRAMAEAIVESDYKSDILYFLGTHVKEAERIASMNPIQAVKEIARIESRFAERKKSNITKAPRILEPLNGSKAQATHGDPSKMEMDEFTNWYKSKFG